MALTGEVIMPAYWLEIAMVSYDLATTWWPIPTIILAVLVILVKASQEGNWKSLNEWALSVGKALVIFLIGLFFLYAPYAHNAKLKETIAQDEARKIQQPIIRDDGSQAIINDLRQQLNRNDIDAQELKRLKDQADEARRRTGSENSSLRNRLENNDKTIHQLREKLDDKASRDTLRDNLADYLQQGQAIKDKCVLGLVDAPMENITEWLQKIMGYLKTVKDSSRLARLMSTPTPHAGGSLQIAGKPVSEKCILAIKVIDKKLEILNVFLSELSK